jgi:hypothetical protein
MSHSAEPESGTALSSGTRGSRSEHESDRHSLLVPSASDAKLAGPWRAENDVDSGAISERPQSSPIAPGRVRLAGVIERALRVVGIDEQGPRCEPYFTLQLNAALEVPAAEWDLENAGTHRIRSVELTASREQAPALDALVGQEVRVIGTLYRPHEHFTNVSLEVQRVRGESSWLKALG